MLFIAAVGANCARDGVEGSRCSSADQQTLAVEIEVAGYGVR
jgi:hypothetical protein